uniref:hypothetical protein n=1 Tax=Nonomuraea sp. CA-251285 TaxID=3240002 RepID=UPI003F497EBF
MSSSRLRARLHRLGSFLPILIGRSAQGAGIAIAVISMLFNRPIWEIHGLLVALIGTAMVQGVTEHHHRDEEGRAHWW